jgi:hypothetical protein
MRHPAGEGWQDPVLHAQPVRHHECKLKSRHQGLRPQLGVRAHMKNSLGNLAARDADQHAAIVKNRLKNI